jgi:penicillin-insensitive murein endopeptidase
MQGGCTCENAPYLRIVPVYAQGDVRWGVEPLVGAIDRAARSVRKQFTDSVASVGHLSKPGGGELDRHASHESGRDADVGFYVRDQKGKPLYADHFVAFKGDGTAPSWPGAQFDDARNWAFVSSIASDAHARVTHIFVSTPIRQRLLSYAAKVGAPGNIRVRASELMAQPHGSLPHDDHFHIRVACPSGMDKCIEQPLAHHKKKHPHQNVSGASNNATAHATKPGASADVQRPITRFAVEARLTLISNSEETLDLETVFLRLIDQKEVAA